MVLYKHHNVVSIFWIIILLQSLAWPHIAFMCVYLGEAVLT